MDQKSRRAADVRVVDGGGPRVAESRVTSAESAVNAQKGEGRGIAVVVPDATVGSSKEKGAFKDG